MRKRSVPKFVENMTKIHRKSTEICLKYARLPEVNELTQSAGDPGTGYGWSDSVGRKMWQGDLHDPAELGPNSAVTCRRSQETVGGGQGDDSHSGDDRRQTLWKLIALGTLKLLGPNGDPKGSTSRMEVTAVALAARIRVTNFGDRRGKNAAPG